MPRRAAPLPTQVALFRALSRSFALGGFDYRSCRLRSCALLFLSGAKPQPHCSLSSPTFLGSRFSGRLRRSAQRQLLLPDSRIRSIHAYATTNRSTNCAPQHQLYLFDKFRWQCRYVLSVATASSASATDSPATVSSARTAAGRATRAADASAKGTRRFLHDRFACRANPSYFFPFAREPRPRFQLRDRRPIRVSVEDTHSSRLPSRRGTLATRVGTRTPLKRSE